MSAGLPLRRRPGRPRSTRAAHHGRTSLSSPVPSPTQTPRHPRGTGGSQARRSPTTTRRFSRSPTPHPAGIRPSVGSSLIRLPRGALAAARPAGVPSAAQPATAGIESSGPVRRPVGRWCSAVRSGGGYGPGTEHERVVSSRRRPAGKGWRKVVSKMTFGLITPGPSATQGRPRNSSGVFRSSLLDVYVVAFVNAKGGVGKTTMTVAAGSAIARERGDRVIAVDVDTDLGNLSSRFHEHGGPNANIEALSSLQNAGSYSNVRGVHCAERRPAGNACLTERSTFLLHAQQPGLRVGDADPARCTTT